MSNTVKVELTPEAEATLRAMQQLPVAMVDSIKQALDSENLETLRWISLAYLSFPKHGPTTMIGLRADSGLLRGSMRASKAAVSGNTISSAIGSNVRYAAAHEFGFTGSVSIPPHVRRVRTRDIRGKQEGKRRLLASGIGVVRGHPRRMNLPERGYTRRGIALRMPFYGDALSAAITRDFMEGSK